MERSMEVVRALYDAMGRGDAETALGLLDADLVFELGGKSRFAGRHTGRDKLFALQGELAQLTGLETSVDAIYDGDKSAIVHQHGRARDGYTDEALLLFEIADGRVIAIKEFLFDQPSFDALVG